MDTDYDHRERKKILEECQNAIQRRDYSHANDCFDRVYYLQFNTLLRDGEIISELEDALGKIEMGLPEEKRGAFKELAGQKILSMKRDYAKISAKLREMWGKIQEHGTTNAPAE